MVELMQMSEGESGSTNDGIVELMIADAELNVVLQESSWIIVL